MEYIKIGDSYFSTSTGISKKDFFETYKNKKKYPFDCDEVWKELVKYLPKQEKQVKEK
jgi:hypothetical protein